MSGDERQRRHDLPREGYVARVAELVRAAGGAFIADEIATGFGRTGTWFASDREVSSPTSWRSARAWATASR